MIYVKKEADKIVGYHIYQDLEPKEVKRQEALIMDGVFDLCESMADAKRAYPEIKFKMHNPYSDFWF
jgi:hypothetical protein